MERIWIFWVWRWFLLAQQQLQMRLLLPPTPLTYVGFSATHQFHLWRVWRKQPVLSHWAGSQRRPSADIMSIHLTLFGLGASEHSYRHKIGKKVILENNQNPSHTFCLCVLQQVGDSFSLAKNKNKNQWTKPYKNIQELFVYDVHWLTALDLQNVISFTVMFF